MGESTKAGESIAKTKSPKRVVDTNIWEILKNSRSSGQLYNVYKHRTKGFQCRSLKEVEEYEAKGIHPSKRRAELRKLKLQRNKLAIGVLKRKKKLAIEPKEQQPGQAKVMSSGRGAAVKLKEEEEAAQVELELKVLEAFEIYPPHILQGIHRHFVLYGMMEYLKKSFNRHFSSEEVLQLVDRFYNVEMLKDDEEIELLNHEEDFSLPKSYFAKDK